MKTLHLTLKKKWFDMILSGEKKEEYREIKPYWKNRLGYYFYSSGNPNDNGYFDEGFKEPLFNVIEFKNGYSKNAPTIIIELIEYYTGIPKPEWCDDYEDYVFILKLGKIIETKNIKQTNS